MSIELVHAQQFFSTDKETLALDEENYLTNSNPDEKSIFETTLLPENETEQSNWDILSEVLGEKSISENSKIDEFKKKDDQFLTIWQLKNRYSHQ